jgi:hypothetical protein
MLGWMYRRRSINLLMSAFAAAGVARSGYSAWPAIHTDI